MHPTRRTSRPSQPGLVSTAGALVALVAVAAMMTSSAVATPSPASHDARQTVAEGAKVRAAVAAVAAAARTLVDGDRLVDALPADWSDDLCVVRITCVMPVAAPRIDSTIAELSESLLDLPPPMRG